ncbi:hypothetical protein FH972_021585 [Carpinus fangiana]|uniref:Uncharacterized protein n=1 Tax=Carpinus fangiana TaxID=176857 RepID=A0A5N6KQ45_9ROSI|nr:hypothetical protein FH972_021585 [Carpinus fangiana]
MSSQSHLSYHPAAELKEALPDHLLLYALGYFGLITPVTRHELAARFTCPTNNSQARRGSTKLIMKREAKLIDQLMRPGENGALWRRTHRDRASSLPVPQHWTVPDDAFELTLPEALRLNDAIHVSEIGRYMRLYQCAFTGARDMILVEFWGGQRPAHMGYRFDPNAG